jgi:hypothetical protein
VVRQLHHLVHLLHLENDMDQKMLVLHLYVVDSYQFQFQFQFQHLLDVVHLDVLQNLDEQNLDAHLPYLDVVRQFLVVVVVGVELHPLLRLDYFQVLVDLDVVGVELHHQLRMDYCQDVELQAFSELQVLLALLLLHLLLLLLLLLQLSLHRVKL